MIASPSAPIKSPLSRITGPVLDDLGAVNPKATLIGWGRQWYELRHFLILSCGVLRIISIC